MTTEERRIYQKQYREEHKGQIKDSRKRKMVERFLADLDHFEDIGEIRRACMKDGTVIDLRKENVS